jgi:hypothetical protein
VKLYTNQLKRSKSEVFAGYEKVEHDSGAQDVTRGTPAPKRNANPMNMGI